MFKGFALLFDQSTMMGVAIPVSEILVQDGIAPIIIQLTFARQVQIDQSETGGQFVLTGIQAQVPISQVILTCQYIQYQADDVSKKHTGYDYEKKKNIIK